MTDYRFSLVAVVSAHDLDYVSQLGQAMGHTSAEFSVALSGNGASPVSHYALHSWITAEAAAVWKGEASPDLDPASGFSETDAAAVLAMLTVSVLDKSDVSSAITHLQSVISPMSLTRLHEE